MNELEKILRENRDKRVAIIGTICFDDKLMESVAPGSISLLQTIYPSLEMTDQNQVFNRLYTRTSWVLIKTYAANVMIEPGNVMYGTVAPECDMVIYLDADIKALKGFAYSIDVEPMAMIDLDSLIRQDAILTHNPVVINIRDLRQEQKDPLFTDPKDIIPVIPLCRSRNTKSLEELRENLKSQLYDKTYASGTWFAVQRLSDTDKEILYIRGIQNQWPNDDDLRAEIAHVLPEIIGRLVDDIEIYFNVISVHEYLEHVYPFQHGTNILGENVQIPKKPSASNGGLSFIGWNRYKERKNSPY